MVLNILLWSLSCADPNIYFWSWNLPWCWSHECFCLPSAAIAWTLASTFLGHTALMKGPQRFWLHCHSYRCILMLTCQTHLGCMICQIFLITKAFKKKLKGLGWWWWCDRAGANLKVSCCFASHMVLAISFLTFSCQWLHKLLIFHASGKRQTFFVDSFQDTMLFTALCTHCYAWSFPQKAVPSWGCSHAI